jgi:g-D-glutamyl-meso-diaminopimelate peptidase
MVRILSVLLLFSNLFAIDTHASVNEKNEPYSYEKLDHDIEGIQAIFKDEVQVVEIGKTHFGRSIVAVKLGKGKHNIVLIGAHHGREWITTMLLMQMLESYAQSYQNKEKFGSYSTDILNDVSIWFVPMLNPDGVTIQQNGVELYPQEYQGRLLAMNQGLNNFERWKANGMGVDLNRQYPAGWGALKGPNGPHYQFFKGRKPLEAKEVLVLTNFIDQVKPSIAVAYHSSGREIFWNYFNGENVKRDQAIADKISDLTGYKLGKPPVQAVGGGFTDWFITKYQLPAMTIEISYHVGETSPPLSVFNTEWERNKYVGLTLAAEAMGLLNKGHN